MKNQMMLKFQSVDEKIKMEEKRRVKEDSFKFCDIQHKELKNVFKFLFFKKCQNLKIIKS